MPCLLAACLLIWLIFQQNKGLKDSSEIVDLVISVQKPNLGVYEHEIDHGNDSISCGDGGHFKPGPPPLLGCHVFDPRFIQKRPAMTLLEFLILLLIAATVGAFGELLGRHSPGGSLLFVFLAFIGAYFGKWLAWHLSLPEPARLIVSSLQFPLLWSMISSILLVSLLCLYQRLRV